MSSIELFLLSLALAADAFTIGAGVGLTHSRPRQVFRLSFHFGLFQGLLALIGILLAFVALYYYLGIVKWMYLYRSDEEEVAIPVSRAAKIGLVVSIFFVLYLGIFAGQAFEITRQAAAAFFPG